MKDDGDIVSGFAGDEHGETPPTVDFAKARRLDRGGSTCDGYECVIQRRRVFVKRLKPEYRDNPVYRAAFDKEYDLGVGLSHPSLPRYVGYGSDYIVMDYIEGDTLADLIKRGDRRLKDKGFVGKLLSELIDVVEYLHNLNIVHCDVKTDNVIISPFKDRPATLIDLDKAYTSWLAHTPGDPAIYDCVGYDDGAIDFRGIGMIADTLGQKRVAAACREDDATAATVRKALRQSIARKRTRIWAAAAVVALSGAVALLMIPDKGDDIGVLQPSPSAPSPDSVATELAGVPTAADTVGPKIGERSAAPDAAAETRKPEATTHSAVAASGISTDNAKDVDDIVARYYGPLFQRQKYLRQLAADPAASAHDLRISLVSYAKDQEVAQRHIFRGVAELYGVSDWAESTNIVCSSNEWQRFMDEDAAINSLYGREIKAREAAAKSPRGGG